MSLIETLRNHLNESGIEFSAPGTDQALSAINYAQSTAADYYLKSAVIDLGCAVVNAAIHAHKQEQRIEALENRFKQQESQLTPTTSIP